MIFVLFVTVVVSLLALVLVSAPIVRRHRSPGARRERWYSDPG